MVSVDNVDRVVFVVVVVLVVYFFLISAFMISI